MTDLIIDACCLSRVFNEKNADHERFKAVRAWLRDRKGRMVYGGSTYRRELDTVSGILKHITELVKGRQLDVHVVSSAEVDEHERRVRALRPVKAFDDPHLVAIVCVSRCRVLCTDEQTALPYLKDKSLYIGGAKVPKIYSRDETCAHLLTNNRRGRR